MPCPEVLSYQRRVLSIKAEFLKRCARTPLGVCHDYFDRTEAPPSRHCVLSHRVVALARALCTARVCLCACVCPPRRRPNSEAPSTPISLFGTRGGKRPRAGSRSHPYLELQLELSTSSGQAPNLSLTCRTFTRIRATTMRTTGQSIIKYQDAEEVINFVTRLRVRRQYRVNAITQGDGSCER